MNRGINHSDHSILTFLFHKLKSKIIFLKNENITMNPGVESVPNELG